MRGKAVSHAKIQRWKRITPAYAGKRDSRLIYLTNNQGSPPPMRGKVPIAGTCKTPVGITPAYAGKSHLEPS